MFWVLCILIVHVSTLGHMHLACVLHVVVCVVCSVCMFVVWCVVCLVYVYCVYVVHMCDIQLASLVHNGCTRCVCVCVVDLLYVVCMLCVCLMYACRIPVEGCCMLYTCCVR